MVLLTVASVTVAPPAHLPDLFPVLISAFSCAHFLLFLVSFHYLQFTSCDLNLQVSETRLSEPMKPEASSSKSGLYKMKKTTTSGNRSTVRERKVTKAKMWQKNQVTFNFPSREPTLIHRHSTKLPHAHHHHAIVIISHWTFSPQKNASILWRVFLKKIMSKVSSVNKSLFKIYYWNALWICVSFANRVTKLNFKLFHIF